MERLPAKPLLLSPPRLPILLDLLGIDLSRGLISPCHSSPRGLAGERQQNHHYSGRGGLEEVPRRPTNGSNKQTVGWEFPRNSVRRSDSPRSRSLGGIQPTSTGTTATRARNTRRRLKNRGHRQAGLSATAASIAAAADNELEEADRRMRTAPLRAPVLFVRWLSAPEGADRQGEDAVVDAERAGAGM